MHQYTVDEMDQIDDEELKKMGYEDWDTEGPWELTGQTMEEWIEEDSERRVREMAEKDKLIQKYKARSTAGGRQPNLSKKSSQRTLSKSPIRKVHGKNIFT